MIHTRSVATFTSMALAASITAFSVVPGRASVQSVSADGGSSRTASVVANERGSRQLVVDWNRELLTIEQTPGAQPATVHPSGRARDAGLAAGARVATLMLALRAHDGSSNPPPLFVARNQPGGYQVTPPNVGKQPVFTGWGSVTPWVLESGDRFRPAPPPGLASAAWGQAIDEVHRLGGGQGSPSARTADETQIGLFWAPPIWNTWNEIADGQLTARHSSLETASHVLADLDLTIADSVIALYDAKYTYAFWRPITAVRAGTPGNAAVDAADSSWNPLAPTALDPSYPGAHATVSEAAATVLTEFFGPHVDTSVHSDAVGFAGVSRSFSSFQAAAAEASFSRILAGQHTSIDETAGEALGRQVANALLAQPFGQR